VILYFSLPIATASPTKRDCELHIDLARRRDATIDSVRRRSFFGGVLTMAEMARLGKR